MERAQGAIEYLLIIGAAVIIAVIVIALMMGLAGTGTSTAEEAGVESSYSALEGLKYAQLYNLQVGEEFNPTEESKLAIGLEGLYHLNNEDKDHSGNGRDSTTTLSNWTTGRWGTNTHTFGTQHMDLSSNKIILPDNTSWTISTWIKPSNIGNYRGIYGNTLTGGNYERFQLAVGKFFLSDSTNTSGGSTAQWDQSLQINTWYMITLVCNGTNTDNVELFIDGVSQGKKTMTNSKQTVRKIGSRGANTVHNYQGLIEDFAVWSRALSNEEISALHYKGSN